MPYRFGDHRIGWRECVALLGAVAMGLMGWVAIYLAFCFGSNH
jgi:hypothetical protein